MAKEIPVSLGSGSGHHHVPKVEVAIFKTEWVVAIPISYKGSVVVPFLRWCCIYNLGDPLPQEMGKATYITSVKARPQYNIMQYGTIK